VPQLGGLVQVVLLLGPLGFLPGFLDLLPQGLDLLDRHFLGFVPGLQGVGLGPHLLDFLLQLGQAIEAGPVGFLLQCGLLDLQLPEAPASGVQLGGHGVDLGPDEGAGLVHEVDGLVRQETVGDVAVRENGCRHEGVVLDPDPVVDLESLAQAPEDGDRVLNGRRFDQDGLEPPLQGGVLFQVLAILVQGRGPDAVQFAPGQHGLQHVARVDGSLGLPGPDDGVQFVDEQDDLSFAFLHLVEDGLQALLELAPELGPGEQCPHVEGEDRPVLQVLGDVLADDAGRQSLHYGGLPDAGLPDEDGVVLRLAAQDSDDPADLFVAPDDRVKLVLPGHGDEVAAVLGKGFVGRFRGGAGHAGVAPHGREGIEEAVGPYARLPEQAPARGVGPLFQDREEKVFHRDVLVLQAPGAFLRGGHDLPQSHRDRDAVRVEPWAGNARSPGDLPLHGGRQAVQGDLHALHEARDEAVGLAEEGQEKVFSVNLRLPVPDGDRLGLGQGFL